MFTPLPILTRTYPPNPALHLPELALSFEQRQRPRLRSLLGDGREVSVLLPPPVHLKDQDLLGDAEQAWLRILALPEPLIVASTEDPALLARAAYHLGNRHVALEFYPGAIALEPDHVLRDLLIQMGLAVHADERPFNPERGAYAAHQHGPRRFVHAP